jgi:hypothetical protein
MVPWSGLPANDNARAGVLDSLELPPRRVLEVSGWGPISQGALALVGGLLGGFVDDAS